MSKEIISDGLLIFYITMQPRISSQRNIKLIELIVTSTRFDNSIHTLQKF